MRSKRLISEETLRRGFLPSGVAATGFAALEGAKPGRSTDARGVVGDGGAAGVVGDASGVVAGRRAGDRLPERRERRRCSLVSGVGTAAAGEATGVATGEGA